MIMNDIEKYFDSYRSLADEAGADPSVSEQDFLGRSIKSVQGNVSADVQLH